VLGALLSGACGAPRTALPAEEPPARADADGLALDGYDPMAYHLERRALPGSLEHTARHEGVTYRFASAAHREAFVAAPERFAPAYGGWCAWALADGEGSLVEIDPRSFLLQDGEVLLFYDGAFADTRAWWQEGDGEALRRRADRNWQRLLAER